jgi:DNA-binding transcriptional regulator of glucitol operon
MKETALRLNLHTVIAVGVVVVVAILAWIQWA